MTLFNKGNKKLKQFTDTLIRKGFNEMIILGLLIRFLGKTNVNYEKYTIIWISCDSFKSIVK